MSTSRHPRRRSLIQRLAAWLMPPKPVAPPPLQQAAPYRPVAPAPPLDPRDVAVLARFRDYHNGRADRTWATFLLHLAAEERHLTAEVAALEKKLAEAIQRSRIIL